MRWACRVLTLGMALAESSKNCLWYLGRCAWVVLQVGADALSFVLLTRQLSSTHPLRTAKADIW